MKSICTFIITFLLILEASVSLAQNTDPVEEIKLISHKFNSHELENLVVQNQGRLKPFHSLARESMLFIMGKYSMWGLNASEIYIGSILSPSNKKLEVINIRNKVIRQQLGFEKSKRYFSIAQLEGSPLEEMAKPLLQKEEQNARTLEPEEKDFIEAYNQFWFFKSIASGNHFFQSLDFSSINSLEHGTNPQSSIVLKIANEYLSNLAEENEFLAQTKLQELKIAVLSQKVPELFQRQLPLIELEIFYHKAKLFFIAAILMLLLGLVLLFKPLANRLTQINWGWIMTIPFLLLLVGFTIRVIITGFAPVTNMYGTMIWVAFGISLFSLILLFFYKNTIVVAALWITSSFFLFVTESIPLILSPDMDPIVAVLRSNLWLTIHVLTIVISYAAFSITMALGNIILIRSLLYNKYDDPFVKEYSHYIYRMTQLGVFLLSIGIILGGVWADYSWGRFWGWDPKETWSLIADIGFLAILHARYAGWLNPFTTAVYSCLAYLLIVMAWYGVNFILAAGLHSYGFSSGGTAVVLTFVSIQLLLVAAAVIKKRVQ